MKPHPNDDWDTGVLGSQTMETVTEEINRYEDSTDDEGDGQVETTNDDSKENETLQQIQEIKRMAEERYHTMFPYTTNGQMIRFDQIEEFCADVITYFEEKWGNEGVLQINNLEQQTLEDSASELELSEAEDDASSDEDVTLSRTNELLHFTMDNANEATQMMVYIARRYEEVFPKLGGKRFLHLHQFELLIKQLRNMFWTHRLVPVHYDYGMIVSEKIPIGSQFENNGYRLPSSQAVRVGMREAITNLRRQFQFKQSI